MRLPAFASSFSGGTKRQQLSVQTGSRHAVRAPIVRLRRHVVELGELALVAEPVRLRRPRKPHGLEVAPCRRQRPAVGNDLGEKEAALLRQIERVDGWV